MKLRDAIWFLLGAIIGIYCFLHPLGRHIHRVCRDVEAVR